MLTDFSNVLTDIQHNMSSRMLERVMQAVRESQPKRQEAEATSMQVALNKAELPKAESIVNQMSTKARRAAEAEVKRHQKAWMYVTGEKTSPAYQKAFDRIPKHRQDSWRKIWRNRLAARRRYRENLLDLRPYNMAVSPGQQLGLVVWGLKEDKFGQLMLVNAQGNLVKAPGFNQKVKNGNVSVTFPDDLPGDGYAMQLAQKINGSDIIIAAKNFPITVKAVEDEVNEPQDDRVFELAHGFGLHVPASTPPNDVVICTITGQALATLRVECVQGEDVQVDPNADQLDPYGRIGASFITPASGEYFIRITRTDVEPPQVVEQSLFVEGTEAPDFNRIMNLSGKPQLPRIGDVDATGGSKITYDVSGFEPTTTRTFEALEVATQTPWLLATVKPGQKEVRFTLMSVDGTAPVELCVTLTLDGTILAEDRLIVSPAMEPEKA